MDMPKKYLEALWPHQGDNKFMEPSQRIDSTLAITTSRASELFCTIQDSCRIYTLTFHAFLIFDRLNLGAWDSLHVGI